MKDFEKLDQLLWEVNSSKSKPDDNLDQKVINKIRERDRMKSTSKKRLSAVAIVAMLIVTTSITAFAAWKLLTPKEVAENLGDKSLANAFGNEGTLSINQTQNIGDYKVSLMELVSGRELSDFKHSAEEIFPDRTYAVLAISQVDGTPMPDPLDPLYDEISFIVSPFVKGQHPKDLNIFTMNGAASWFVKDGVMYRIMECDDIEVFADRGLYIAVMDEFNIMKAYNFNVETGEIKRNADYEGMNALFDLPLDPSKGNYEKAEEYLRTLSINQEKSDKSIINEEIEDMESFLEGFVLIPESVQQIIPNEVGRILYIFDREKALPSMKSILKDAEIGRSDISYFDQKGIVIFSRDVDDMFEEEQVGFSSTAYLNENYVLVFSRDVAGIIEGKLYKR